MGLFKSRETKRNKNEQSDTEVNNNPWGGKYNQDLPKFNSNKETAESNEAREKKDSVALKWLRDYCRFSVDFLKSKIDAASNDSDGTKKSFFGKLLQRKTRQDEFVTNLCDGNVTFLEKDDSQPLLDILGDGKTKDLIASAELDSGKSFDMRGLIQQIGDESKRRRAALENATDDNREVAKSSYLNIGAEASVLNEMCGHMKNSGDLADMTSVDLGKIKSFLLSYRQCETDILDGAQNDMAEALKNHDKDRLYALDSIHKEHTKTRDAADRVARKYFGFNLVESSPSATEEAKRFLDDDSLLERSNRMVEEIKRENESQTAKLREVTRRGEESLRESLTPNRERILKNQMDYDKLVSEEKKKQL